MVVSAKIESEIAVMPLADQGDFLEAVGLDPVSTASSALDTICSA